MITYIALLRGINVSGHKIIKMEALRAALATLGFKDVTTYVQSGNVVFQTSAKSDNLLARQIKAQILKCFGFEVPVILRTAQELDVVAKANPFLKDQTIDASKLHITLLSAAAPATAANSLAGLVTKPEQFHVHGREIYLYCPNGYGNTKLSNGAIEKKLGLEATTRNCKSVNALLAIAQKMESTSAWK